MSNREQRIEALRAELRAIEVFDRLCKERPSLTNPDRTAIQARDIRRQEIQRELAELLSQSSE